MRVLLAAVVGVIPCVPAEPPPTPHPPPARPCRAAELRVVSYEVQGATGSLAGGVVLRNAGAPCSLVGRPQVTFDSPQIVTEGSFRWPDSDPVPPSFSMRAIPTGARVGFDLWWSNWCGLPPATMLVGLPHGGGVVRVEAGGAPRCDSTFDASSISVSTFRQMTPQAALSTHLPFAIGFRQAPVAVRAGSVLRFEVTLRNTGAKPFRFGSCPAYVESLVETTIIDELHVLNCRPAGAIAPGGTRVFAMQMRVPARAAGREWALFFELGPHTYEPDQAPPGANPMVAVS